ncbi:hypothetical protein [Staphylococcus capitis]|uniref:hypothetical protein n=1 Tax=Staphylococcus capitis TaxID=29388 RepID=UPI0011A3A9F7|nr:hypothetical protein [Staphylococcus capitis]
MEEGDYEDVKVGELGLCGEYYREFRCGMRGYGDLRVDRLIGRYLIEKCMDKKELGDWEDRL